MATDLEILTNAYNLEARHGRGFNAWGIGANKRVIDRFLEEGLIYILWKEGRTTAYSLTPKAQGMVAVGHVERERVRIGADEVLEALQLIKGFDDIKGTIAAIVENGKRVHVLMEGPPASAKSLFLSGIQDAVDPSDVYLAFGSRTTAAGLSGLLFANQPSFLLMDEVDKMKMDAFSVLLGLMESGEVIETTSKNTRGVKLNTVVLGACNDSSKLPREFLSRFALHVHFPRYSRDDFLEIAEHLLSNTQGCPAGLARAIGAEVFDKDLGDIRKVRGVWDLMAAPTEAEMRRVVGLMDKYSPQNEAQGKKRGRQSVENGRLF